MIRHSRWFYIGLATLLFSACGAWWNSTQAGNKSVFLRIRSAPLYSKPDLSQPLEHSIELGSSLEVLESKGAWIRVKVAPPKHSKQIEAWLPVAWTSEQAVPTQPKGEENPAATTSMQTKIIAFTASRGGKEEHLRTLWARQAATVDTAKFLKDGKLGGNREADAFPLEGAAK